MRVVARQAEQQRRHAERERDLARGGGLRFDEIHVLRRQRQGLPVEPAFQQQRPAGIGGTLVVRLELGLQPVELRFGQAPFRRTTSAPEGRAELSSSALFQAPAALWMSSATAAASMGESP